uniref:Uncharacterized protein n=1 Tax=Aegilops tauschii subsp. strangulata TaxID=200361 RepID=A0A453SLD7_AEGTS
MLMAPLDHFVPAPRYNSIARLVRLNELFDSGKLRVGEGRAQPDGVTVHAQMLNQLSTVLHIRSCIPHSPISLFVVESMTSVRSTANNPGADPGATVRAWNEGRNLLLADGGR